MEEINKYLTEQLGECWHEYVWQTAYAPQVDSYYKCIDCSHEVFGQTMNPGNGDFSTPDGFFKLWRWAIEQEWWNDFINSIGGWTVWIEPEKIIDPETFAKAIANYLKEREGK